MPEIKTGLVAVLDILGYENLLERKSAEYVASEVIRVVNEAPDKAKGEVQADISPMNKIPEKAKRAVHALREGTLIESGELVKSVVFSDTIVLTCEVDRTNTLACHFLTVQVCLIYARLFMSGLPIRGAIGHGRFFHSGVSLAGNAVVEALKWGRSIDAAAIVCPPPTDVFLRECNVSLPPKMASEYLMPLKSGSPLRMLVLNPLTLLGPSHISLGTDIRQAVHEAFWGHGKDIPPSAYSKLFNTEMLFRFQRKK